MAQHDYIISNQTFPNTRADINNVLSAIASNNSGTSAPTTQYAGQFWIDTTSSTWTLYIHDGSDDIQFATIDTSANTVNFIDSELGDNSVTTSKIADANVTSAKLSYPLTTFSSTGIDDNATSTAITIDSSERVGIGTTNPAQLLEIYGTSPNVQWTYSGDGNNHRIFSFSDDFYIRADANNTGAGNLVFQNGGSSERMRIDSSGNLLVGKTTTTINDVGVALLASGNGGFTRSSGVPLNVNRKTDDGTIISVRKDGTEVGSISSNDGDLLIGTGDTGFRFYDAGDAIIPNNISTPGNRDNAIDLGLSSVRYKDLYLGGGLYVGGTASANKLDDYEEGTWTPTLNSGTCTVISAKYTKIGNQCTLHFRVTNFSDSSSATDIQITGMPFAQPSNTETGVGTAYGERSNVNKPTVDINANIIRFRNGFGVSTFDTPLQYSNINDGADFDIIATVTYETA